MKASKLEGPTRRKRIILVDDHPMTRAGLAELINKQPDLEMCCDAGSPAEALQKMSKARPDLLVTDITMPGRSGLEFIKDALAFHPKLPILVVSMHDEQMYAERALHCGARGYIMKEAGAEMLLTAMRCVLSGEIYLSNRVSGLLLGKLIGRPPRASSSPIEKLTDREFDVFRLLGEGKTTREIALQLHLSPKTVDVHRSHIKEKLALKGSTALLRFAVRWADSQDSARSSLQPSHCTQSTGVAKHRGGRREEKLQLEGN
jgi:DNA-binding NarL/FixJ family response regulator